MHRKYFCCGNWKMNVLKREIEEMLESLRKKVAGIEVDLVVAPPSVYLQYTLSELPSTFKLGAQNCYKHRTGDFTGELSPAMLIECGVEWVIIGHSERRRYFNETDHLIAEKIKHAQTEGLKVIACVGENLIERENEKTSDVIMNQLKFIHSGVTSWDGAVLAYEPVWTMETGLSISVQQIQEVHKLMRKWLQEKSGVDVADSTRIVYGGSVNLGNCRDISRMRDVDGFLVSGASLLPDFADICNIGF